MNPGLLGGLPASTFLRRYWQKEALLVRGALPRFAGFLNLDGMIELACREDCESRLVFCNGTRWAVEHGPFSRARFARLPARRWTLLVQGVDQFLPEARELLSQFSFIPYSRLDDLMVSYAPAGGGVGPHFDSYDVFLLQGAGQRRWQVGRQRELELVEHAPLKILKRFAPQGQAVLDPGDMLYLPPRFAHEGVAVNPCYTYSIGFRAPSDRELASQFLTFLEERLSAPGCYRDPELRLQSNPAEISSAMIGKMARTLREIRWSRGDVVDFIGSYLTEPKPRVVFSPPRRALSVAAFGRAARSRGVELALPTQMLYSGARLFINGEITVSAGPVARPLRTLAARRRLPGRDVPRDGAAADALYRWYRAGYISLASRSTGS